MNQGRVLHPRPAVPAITSTHSCSEINMLEHIISPGMHSDTKHSPKNGSGRKKKEENGRKKEENGRKKEESGRKKEESGRKKTTLFASLIKSSASASRTESKSGNESHEKYKATDPDELIPPQTNRSDGPHYRNVLSGDGHYKNVSSSSANGRSLTAFVTESSGEPC